MTGHLNELQGRLNDLQNDSLNSLETFEKSLSQLRDRVDGDINSRLSATESAILAVGDTVQKEIKKDIRRLKSHLEENTALAGAAIISDETRLAVEQLRSRLDATEAFISKQMDLSGSKFSSIKDIAAALKGVKQTVSTLAETVLQQSARLQAADVNRRQDTDTAGYKEEFNKRLSSCELAVCRISSIELGTALSAQRLGSFEKRIADVECTSEALDKKVSNLYELADHLKTAKSAAKASATVAAAATAVIEDLAKESNRHALTTEDREMDEKAAPTIPKIWSPPARRSESLITESMKAAEYIQQAGVSAKKKSKKKDTIEELRNEKARLVRELYGTSL